MEKIKLIGLSGSLRKESYNTSLLKEAQKVLPAEVEMEIFDIGTLPLYNQDMEANLPETVKGFKEKIRQANGLLIACPEYNYGYSGVLKNAIDWASRPDGDLAPPLLRKPAGIMGASISFLGTARAQYPLRQVLGALNMPLVMKPEIFVTEAMNKFTAEGQLTDPMALKMIEQMNVALLKLINK
ncbi:MAG: NAD(P)H-dependent oxidoreductase [Negativicutes bacterium]|nr:NAD(P)H-dependent oxidoreductase [Negativicutes bacterium]